MKKKITLIGVNFYPEDTAIGLYSTDMMNFFSEKGYQVNVITGFPYYPQWEIHKDYKKKNRFLKENINGIDIYRYKQYVPSKPSFFLRIIHIIDFTFGSFINLFKVKKTDIVISIVPFTSSIFLGWILKIKCGAKLWVHIQDFEFDAALQTGVAQERKNPLKKFAFYFLFKIERILLSKANKQSTISFKMVEKLNTKTNNSHKTTYLPNWIDAVKINPLKVSQHEYLKSNKFKILYSGNIGDKQDWKLFLEFVNLLDPKRHQVIIVGDGSKKDWLLKQISQKNLITYHPPVPFNDLGSLLCSADLHFLFQKNNVIDTVMPSKLLGMMASEKPSLVTGNVESEVKRVLEESGGGFYFHKNEIEESVKALNKLENNKELCISIGKNARRYALKNFTRKEILSKMLFETERL